jgi:hypothetical protein
VQKSYHHFTVQWTLHITQFELGVEGDGGGGHGGINKNKNNPGLTYWMVTQLTFKAPVISFAMFLLATSEVH